MTKRRQPRRRNSRKVLHDALRRLGHETLERRELLAANPRLIGVNPDAGEIFSAERLNQLNAAPNQLTFRFDGGQQLDAATLGGIRIIASGGDNDFDDGDEDVIIPGFLGFADNQQTVVARFAETLPDDRYRIEIAGEDNTNLGVQALRNITGDAFRTLDGDTIQTIDFDVERGGQVIAVVPQPIDPVDGVLVRRDDEIEVYFDDPDLFRPGSTVDNPAFYQLIDTQSTVTTEDDQSINPISVTTDAAAKMVTLRFAGNIDTLIPGKTNTSYRLRIGDSDDFETLSVQRLSPGDPSLIAANAYDLAANAVLDDHWTVVVSQSISNSGLTPMADNPGGTDEPGHRDIEVEDHYLSPGSRDSNNSITQISYTFLRDQVYGFDANGDPLMNQMNEAQEQRFKEVLDLYDELLGIDFIETRSSGLRLIVGDLFTADPSRVSGPGGVAGLGGPGGVTMDFADFTTSASNQFGGGFFNVALHEIGHAIGLGHAYDLPGAVMGSRGANDPVFPSNHDLAHGEYLHQKESIDADLYRIVVDEPGVLVATTIAERLSNSSRLDTRLTLYRQEPGERPVLIAANNDYFGSDSFLEMQLDVGVEYFVGVAAQGNTAFDVESGLTADGGVSQGNYDLRLEFRPDIASNTIIDADASPLDGDNDGLAGGNHNFWFETSTTDTLYVRKPDLPSDQGGDGSLAAPFDNIDDALVVAATRPNAIVRVLANDGLDDDITTLADNEAYEIGFVPGLNITLDDGRNVVVPGNTTLMIDAGAILKFSDARMSIGSDDDGVDRSGSSIQVLGTPELPVFFTSFSDATKGINTHPTDITPAPGDWGGIEIRNDVDRDQGRVSLERKGIFQNYINHAAIEFGGGGVSTAGRVIDPVHLSEARAEISHNTITGSARAAVSADPDTFENTSFAAPRFQAASTSGNGFVADYGRIGPDVHGNQVHDNSINGLFVRIDTIAGGALEELNVSARLNDTDIVHVLGENLLLRGQAGSAIRESVRPSQILGLTENLGDGQVASDVYRYSFTFVDEFGYESIASLPQSIVTTGTGAIVFSGITAATGDFVSRRLYRQDGGTGAYRLIAELDRSSSNYTDRLQSPPADAPSISPFVGTNDRGRPDGTLVADPGLIVKSDGARIELGFGTHLVAEGDEGSKIVLTSINDDRYGRGGTFDTNNSTVVASPGDWAGIYAGRVSNLSIDQAVLAYGGGVTGVEGSTAGFNVLEIHQASARVANSRFEFNADGSGGQAGSNRQGRLNNSDATIHVTGAQPIIVGNTFLNNAGAVINADINSFDSFSREDIGRQTGNIDPFQIPPGNQGPVIRGNLLDNNEVNGVELRGDTLFTEVVLDDTDMVHVLRSDLVSTTYHVYGGLRLESGDDESLVVKLDNGAGLIGTGATLDITDRIGGRIQVLGTPGNPVVLTSLFDNTVGAGFTPDGRWQTETVASGTPAAGDWQGISLDPNSHDRNVDTQPELEGDIGGSGDSNSVIGQHQHLGALAPDELSGDENRRLGFTVHGAIAADSDQDIYSFRGTAGTMVWIDIDRTERGLDTILEFLDGNGNVLALSEDSRFESINGQLTYVNPRDVGAGDLVGFDPGHALPMQRDSEQAFNAQGGGNKDLYSTNDGDSAMRVVLPGIVGTDLTYYVRVRSTNPNVNQSNPTEIVNNIDQGRSSGGYQLHIRLQETDEIGGSVVRHADIRYATIGIEAIGLPNHSPLIGDVNNPGGTLDLGGMHNTDRGEVSVSGVINSSADSYTFTVGRDGLQGVPGGANSSPTDHKVSTVIDVDYADGLNRPNTAAYLYHDGVLVAIGTDSNVLDDRVRPTIPNQTTDPSILPDGSLGPKDAFIGPLELSTQGIYEVVITNNETVAPELRQFTDTTPPNSLARLEPLDSTERIADDRFDAGGKPTPLANQGPVALQVAFEDDASNVHQWHLGDVPLIALTDSDQNGQSRLSIYNPHTGRHDSIISRSTSVPVGAIARSLRGDMIAIRENGTAGRNDGNTSTTYSVDVEGNLTQIGTTGIATYEYFLNTAPDPDVNTNRLDNEGMEFSSLTYYNDTNSQTRFLYGLANRGTFAASTVVPDNNNNDIIGPSAGILDANNLIYLLDPDTGAAISRGGNNMTGGFESANPLEPRIQNNFNNFNFPPETPWAGTNIVAQVQIPTVSPATTLPTGDVVEIVTDLNGGQFLLAFTDQGAVWQVNLSENAQTGSYAAGDLRGFPTLIVDPTAGPGITDQSGNQIQFEQVTAGPANYNNANDSVGLNGLYFAVGRAAGSAQRRLFAFDMNSQTAQPVFAFGADSIPIDDATGNRNFRGFFFSSLDTNLWHLSDTNEDVPGHGMPELDNDARPNIGGGTSLRFGFDALNDDFNHLSNGIFDNTPDASDLQNFTGYNFLGGAHGTVQSNSLDLTGFVSEDLPTMYFNYMLDSEGRNGSGTAQQIANNPMRDSLRVYVAGDDGDWQMVATNNFDQDASAGGFDWSPTNANILREYDPDISNYGDAGGNRRYVQQLFDSAEFRQARIDLGPWAGQEDVKIRFEFSTAGEARPDQSEIIALAGNLIGDGHTLTIAGQMPDRTSTTLGSPLPTLSKRFEFDVNGDGVSAGNIPINITENSSITQVRNAIQQALANEIRYLGAAANLHAFPVVGDGVRLYDLTITQQLGGGGKTSVRPLTLINGQYTGSGNVPVNQFGVYQGSPTSMNDLIRAGQRTAGLGGANGVYLDDIVIGLAERGESVGGAVDSGTPISNLADNPYYEPTFVGGILPEIDTGAYQLGVRLAREYGDPSAQTGDVLGKIGSARVEFNERLARGLNLTVVDNGRNINDGDTFTLSNGADTLTFEFNLTGGVAQGNVPVAINLLDSQGEVANAIRAAINQVNINTTLEIVATNRGGQLSDPQETDEVVVIHGEVAANNLGGVNFGPHINATLSGTDEILGEDNGDRNRPRDQGQLLIESNMISFSSDYGVIIDAGPTTAIGPFNVGNLEGDRPKPGAVQNFPTLNTAEQIPGAVIRNNLLYNNTNGGVLVSSDTSTGAPSGFVRVTQNTVYGSTVGIRVDDQAAPAMLNNVLMNNGTGLQLAGASETLIRGTVFEGNGTSGPLGTEFELNPGVPLFINPNPVSFDPAGGAPNFYPAPGSPVLDNSIPQQNDRPVLVSVKQVVGIPASPILSPLDDLYGQTRSQFFADRGAIEAGDDQGPIAELLVPLDNDLPGVDVDPRETVVQLTSGRLFRFDIVINDGEGSGPDASTITADRVAVVENGRLLTSGVDYTFSYNATSGVLRLTPTSGEWRPDSVYRISLNNTTQQRIDAVDGSQIADGDQIILVDDQGNRAVIEYEGGNAVQVPQTLSLRIRGANNSFTDGDQFRITAPDGSLSTFEINKTGNISAGTIPVDLTSAGTTAEVRQAFFDAISPLESTLDLALRFVNDDVLQLGTLLGHRVTPVPFTTTVDGLDIFGVDGGVEEGQEFTYTAAANNNTITFSFTSNPVLPSDILFSRTDTPDELAAKIAAAVAAQDLGLAQARAVGDGVVAFGGAADDILDVGASSMTQVSAAGTDAALTLEVPSTTTVADLDGDSFTITVGSRTEIFRFTTSATLPIVGRRVLLTAGQSPAGIASTLAGVIATTFAGDLSPSTQGNVIHLGEQSAVVPDGVQQVLTSADVAGTELLFAGTSGGVVPLPYFPTSQFTESASAQGLSRAIRISSLEIGTVTPGGGIVLLDGVASATSITSAGSTPLGSSIGAIADLAGNSLLANQPGGTTRFTIVMPDVQLDYGDATDSYQTTLDNNGPRHAIIRDATPRLGSVVDTESAAQVDPDSDDRRLVVSASGDSIFAVDTSLPNTTEISVNGPALGGEILTITIDGVPTNFELVTVTGTPAAGSVIVPLDPADSDDEIAENLIESILTTIEESNDGLIITRVPEGSDTIRIVTIDDEDGLPVGSFLGTVTTEGLILADDSTGSTTDPGEVIGFLNVRDPAGTVLPITLTGAGLLDGWIDFNRDGDFNDPSERIFNRLPVVDGLNPLRINTPPNASLGLTQLRLRVSTEGSDSWVGIAPDGEVEDYVLQIFDIPLPIPGDDSYSVAEDNDLIVDGIANVSMFDNDVLPVEEFVQSEFTIFAPIIPDPNALLYRTDNGVVRVDDPALGLFTYTPDPDFYGADSFLYSVSTQRNGGLEIDFATVNITVTPVNDAPGASNIPLRTIEDIDEVDLVNGGFLIPAGDLLTFAVPDADPLTALVPQDESNQQVFVQSLSTAFGMIDASNPTAEITTVRGGTLSATFDANDHIISVLYRPAQDFNSENLPATVGNFFDDSFDFTVVDDGISLPVDGAAATPPDPKTATASAIIRVTPQNDEPVPNADAVSIRDQDYLDFFVDQGLTVPVPTEDQTLLIPGAFLLDNDLQGPPLAADETSQFNGNDGPLRIVAASLVNPAQGSVSLDLFTGEITFTPADDIFGPVLFRYTVEDSGIDQAAALDSLGNPAPKLPAPLQTEVTSTIFVEPVNDIPVAIDRAFDVVETIETRPVDGSLSQIVLTPADLLVGSAADLLNPTLSATASDITLLGAPFNEDNQVLQVNSLTVEGVTTSTDLTLTTASGGTLEVDFDANGFLVSAIYTPPVDYNSNTPFVPADTFTYTIVDDGLHDFPPGFPLAPVASYTADTPVTSVEATVSLTVTPANDLPVFDAPTVVDILEDDPSTWMLNNFFTNVAGGPIPTALDEQGQDVNFTIQQISSDPANLMVADPDVSSGSSIQFFPEVDLFGEAVYVVTGTDDGAPNQSFSRTFTVNVRPVNDAPRFDPTVAGSSDTDLTQPDTAYSVAANDFNGDGQIDDATITYTLREDNTQRFGDTSTPYFIPLSAGPPAGGYQQVGLLDVFTVGPGNEAGVFPGGSQVLELLSFGNPPTAGGIDFTTDLGGTLRGVFSGSTLIGLEYIPPTNFNSLIGGFDSFTYEVRDDSTTGGETYDLGAGTLIPDRLTSTNRVVLNLNPVNDRPVFNVVTTSIEVPEDSQQLDFFGFALNINAGPQNTAFDEVDINNGQQVSFTLNPLDFSSGQASDFFTVLPTITSDTGQLTFQAAPDVFGEFDFEILLVDNGAGSADGDNQRGDLNTSLPVTLTIDVQPTNDPPVVDPAAAPLEFSLLEDGTVDILVTGDNTSVGLLDVFVPGPANEAEDILPSPGGNQIVSLGNPIPVTSAAGGSVQAIRDLNTNEILRFVYRPRKDFVGTDSFIYTVVDNGQTVNIGTGGFAFNDPRIASNTVTFEVLPVNDAPQFSGAANVVSDEDDGVVVIDSWANNVQAGPQTAVDELMGLGLTPPQSLEFVFTQLSSNPELFTLPPTAVINGDSASLTYQSAPDANGIATFEVYLRDNGPSDSSIGDEFESVRATFLIEVRPVNDPPSFTAGPTVSVTEDSGPYSEQWATNISPGPADESSQSVQFVVTTPTEFQSLFLNPPTISDAGVLRFTPASNANTDNQLGPALVGVTAIDSAGGQAQVTTLTISVSEVNDTPVANSDAIDTDEDTILTIPSAQILANDIDPDLLTNVNEELTVVMPLQSFSVSGAKVTFDPATGDITYDPTGATALQALRPQPYLQDPSLFDLFRVDSFSYRVVDTAGRTSNLVTVGLTVDGINDAPRVSDDDVDLNQSGPTTIRPLDNDVDVDGVINPASIVVELQPAFGSIAILPGGVLQYTPFATFAVEDQFRYTVADDLGQRSDAALVTISANAAPIAANDAKGTFLDEAIDIDVAANDSDPDGTLDLGSIVIIAQPTRGEAIPKPGGIVQYLPDPGFVGNDTFTYQIFDNEGRGSNVATVSTRVVASRLQNPDLRTDVNDDGFTTSLDALLVINRISRGDGSSSIPVEPGDMGPPFYDVNGNQSVSAADAIIVINELSRLNSAIAGEQVVQPVAETSSSSTDLAVSIAEEAPELVADADKVADAAILEASVSDDLIDLLAAGQQQDEESEAIDALDAAMADLL